MMNILHIAAHLGDGAGKAIGGLARLDAAAGNTEKILLLQKPKKMNHIDRCRAAGVEVLSRDMAEKALAEADVVILNWWGSPVMDDFLREFPQIPCRVLLWTHKNGFYDPPLPQALVDACDGLLVTSPLSLTKWPDATLVYGFGDFAPELIQPKMDYSLKDGEFMIGYIGSPSYKKLPPDTVDYLRAVLDAVPEARFVMAGESSDVFRSDIERAGLADRVELLGWVSDVYGLLRSFDAFGYLMKRDTFATTENAVLEAMAAGVPVLMPREPIGEYVAGDAGMLFDTPAEYATAVKALAESEALRRERGQAGRSRALTVFDREANTARFQRTCVIAAQHKKFYLGGSYDGTIT